MRSKLGGGWGGGGLGACSPTKFLSLGSSEMPFPAFSAGYCQ